MLRLSCFPKIVGTLYSAQVLSGRQFFPRTLFPSETPLFFSPLIFLVMLTFQVHAPYTDEIIMLRIAVCAEFAVIFPFACHLSLTSFSIPFISLHSMHFGHLFSYSSRHFFRCFPLTCFMFTTPHIFFYFLPNVVFN